MAFIEENVKDFPLNRAFIGEMHKMIVEGLFLIHLRALCFLLVSSYILMNFSTFEFYIKSYFFKIFYKWKARNYIYQIG